MRGQIYCPEAYARGKMLNHGDWASILPRSITPSDIDAVFDNNGKLLFVEFSSRFSEWDRIPAGQRRLYQSLCRLGARAVLCKHRIPPLGVEINTLHDVEAFQIMRRNEVGGVEYSRVWPGVGFKALVERHFRN
jgi:hypothetical protein